MQTVVLKKKLCTKGHLYSFTKGHLPVVKLVGIMFFFYTYKICVKLKNNKK